jgi:hypothetical protein
VGSHCPFRIHARSDTKKSINELMMRQRHCLREGEDGKHIELVAPEKTILWAFFFSILSSPK